MSGAAQRSKGFGTFGGVFTPSILTILGVVMYLRLGWATGSVGLGGILLIVLISHLITTATGLSISSIATDRTVGAGGAYFMISRALGAAAGAAIGIPLFFAQALSVTFYIVGFSESLMQILPESTKLWLSPVVISTAVNVLITGVSLKSAELAIKTQYFVMAAIGLSLVSFFLGRDAEFPRTIEWFRSDGESFATVFAVFFPAVTGIMAGVSMSGDLRNPRKSIPVGTMAAIAVGFVIYAAFPVWLSLNRSNESLVTDLEATFAVAKIPALIYVGVWGATLSSALGSILTAPRTLQALALDGLVPRLIGRGYGPSNEPRIGTVLTFVLAQIGIFLGDLDAIAPVLTMFFLATYGVTNLVCGLQKWAANPSFRPSFRVPAFLSLGAALACFYVMSIIDMPAMAAALLLCGLIFTFAQKHALGTTYGDARHGIWSALVRSSLQRLRRATFHPRNWRPNLVILGGSPGKRPYLLELGSSVVQNRGLVTYVHLLRGSVADQAAARKELFELHEKRFAEQFPHVFYRAEIVDDIYRGTVSVAQSYGVGNFEANTVMLGWPRNPERSGPYVDMLRDLLTLERSLLLVRYDPERQLGDRKTIHIWWGGPSQNGSMMMLLAFLITADYQWRDSRIKLITVIDREDQKELAHGKLKRLIDRARMSATLHVVLRRDRSIASIMHEESRHADLVFLGFRLPEPGAPVAPFFERMQSMLKSLPTTMLVHGASGFQGAPVLFDEATRPSQSPESVETQPFVSLVPPSER